MCSATNLRVHLTATSQAVDTVPYTIVLLPHEQICAPTGISYEWRSMIVSIDWSGSGTSPMCSDGFITRQDSLSGFQPSHSNFIYLFRA